MGYRLIRFLQTHHQSLRRSALRPLDAILQGHLRRLFIILNTPVFPEIFLFLVHRLTLVYTGIVFWNYLTHIIHRQNYRLTYMKVVIVLLTETVDQRR